LTNFPDVDNDDVLDTCTKALKWIESNTMWWARATKV
jgi:phage terminase large subunit-like protein